MNNSVYLAMYKGRGNWVDKLIRFFTKGKYSHCEIAIQRHQFHSGDRCRPESYFDCYSSSPRDGGVRRKKIATLEGKTWELIPIDVPAAQIESYFSNTQGSRYDFLGAIGVVLGITQSRSKFFCSEWCFNALYQSEQGWRFSPSELGVMVRQMNKD